MKLPDVTSNTYKCCRCGVVQHISRFPLRGKNRLKSCESCVAKQKAYINKKTYIRIYSNEYEELMKLVSCPQNKVQLRILERLNDKIGNANA